jgi:predicted DNA-binding transcriptional regulator AlpA
MLLSFIGQEQSVMNNIPQIGFIRLPTILELIPISKSTWWEGVKTGRFPKPVKLGARITVWNVESIRNLIEQQNLNGGKQYEPR